ncbi:MAG TPA: metalloregulator ArsR/SmtB family transcription factor [Phycisphaerae bacterium]|nr:metalloregulator ArsR/SmtB family transcription factor [Phycisphaerae bacterium]
MSAASTEQLARVAQALSSPTRLRIVQLLRGRALCVNALSARLDVTQGAVSQHLRILKDAGLVTAQRRGCFIHYRLNEPAMSTCRAALDRLLSVPAARKAKTQSQCTPGRRTLCVAKRKPARSRKT